MHTSRPLLLALLCGAAACGSTPGTIPPTTTDSGTTGAQTGTYCEKPTTGRYAIQQSLAQSSLVLLGDNGWDVVLGPLQLDGNPVRIDTFAHVGASFTGTAGPFRFVWTEASIQGGAVAVTEEPAFVMPNSASNYTAISLFDPNTYIAANGRDIYCGTFGEAFYDGLAVTEGCDGITGIQGTCDFAVNGDFDIDVVATCPGGSRFMSINQVDQVGERYAASDLFPYDLHGLASDGVAVGDNAIWQVDTVGATKIRDTKLCVDEGTDNPFNGTPLGGLELVGRPSDGAR